MSNSGLFEPVNSAPRTGVEGEASVAVDKTASAVFPKIRLRLGGVVSFNRKQWLVERRIGQSWQFLNMEDKDPLFLTDFEIARQQADGQFLLVRQPGDRDDLPPPVEPLNVGSEAHKKNLRKLEYVLACIQHPDYSRTRSILNPIIAAVAKKLGDKIWGFTTVLSWIDKYERNSATYGTAALTDRNDNKGRYGFRLAGYQEDAIRIGIEHWLKRNTKANSYPIVLQSVRKLDDSGKIDKSTLDPVYLDEDNRLKPPCRRTFERRCEQFDPMLSAAMRIGEGYAKQRFRTFTTTPLPDKPYFEVEVDHGTLDIQIILPNGLILGRPDLVVFKDRATAMIIGWGIGFEQPSYTSFLDGLRCAIYPKDLSRFPHVTQGLPAYGLIQNLFVDNALHLIGDNIYAACRQLGINVVRLQPRQPWLKGAVERFFRSLNTGLLHNLPGTTLGNVVDRRENENLGDPKLTFAQFEYLFVKWICDVHNAEPRKALGFIRGFGNQTPLQAWAEKSRDYEIDSLPKPEVFIALAGHVDHRALQKNGFTIDYITYENPNLSRILGNPKHRQKGIHGKSTKYKLSRDPHDLGRIYVLNHHTGETIIVPATTAHLPYAQGLSLTEHDIIRANARRMYGDKHGFEDLMRAKASLNEITAKIKDGPKFKTVQRKFARWLEGDRLRPIRSTVVSFPPGEADYLSPERNPISTTLVEPIGKTNSASAPTEPTPKDDVPTNASPPGGPPLGSDDDDLSDVRYQKNWSSSYVR